MIEYFIERKVSKEGFKVKRLRVLVALFTTIAGQLYKRGFTMIYLMCLRPVKAWEVLFKVHAEIYGNHQGEITLGFKALQ